MGARLILLRHGEIQANRLRRWHGSTDSPLTWRGRRQAKRTGRHLFSTQSLDAVYSSPLQRCQNTARFASSGTNLAVTSIPGLQEMGMGDWEDMLFRDLVEQHDFMRRSVADIDFAAPGGESLAVVADRVTKALRQIDSQHEEHETVLVVSHGVAIAIALSMYLHDAPERWQDFHLDNCSLTEVRLSPDPVIYQFNQNSHL